MVNDILDRTVMPDDIFVNDVLTYIAKIGCFAYEKCKKVSV